MDKARVLLVRLKKYHFWVFTGLVPLLALAVWYLSTGELAAEYKANRDKVESKFNGLSAIVSKTDHPNKTFEKGTRLLEKNLRDDVDQAWTRVYAVQKTKVLKWPEELSDVVEWMDDPGNDKQEIPEDLRDSYWNYVKEEFPNLLKIVDARPYWDKTDDEEGSMSGIGHRRRVGAVGPVGRARPQPAKTEYTVVWDKKNQLLIDESLEFPKGRPTSQQVRFCQENLWVYHALLRAIADVNEGAMGHHNSKIKEIIALHMGQDASELVKESLTPGRIMVAGDVVAGAPPGMADEMPGGMPGRMPGGMPGFAPPGEGGLPSVGALDGGDLRTGAIGLGGVGKPLDDSRYVDEKGMPIPTGTAGPAEFKRMPILMRLFMDQREIANLLVRLANAPLPVEIRQLRINTRMQGFTNPRLMMFGGGQDPGGAMGARGGPAVMKRDKTFEEAAQSPFDVAVELHGIIYIFNPPDRTLRETLVAEGEEAIGEADASTEPESRDQGDEPPSADAAANPAAEPAADGEPDPPPAANADAPVKKTTDEAGADEATDEEPKAKASN